jgi:hypothetical protein
MIKLDLEPVMKNEVKYPDMAKYLDLTGSSYRSVLLATLAST